MSQLCSSSALAVAILLSGCSSQAPSSDANATDGVGGTNSPMGRGGAAGSAQTAGAGGGLAGEAGAGGGAGATAGTGAGAVGQDAGTSGGSGGGASDAGARGDGASTDAGTSWPAVNDYGAPGPFTTQRDNDTGPGGTYDIFHPATLGPEPRKNPIVSWANGTLFDVNSYQKLLDHWASYGFVVIAAHTQSTAGGATHKAGIDWLIAENARSGSIYFGHLDTKAIGAAGHSQGGGATIAAGSDEPGPTGIVVTLPMMPILSFETDKTIVMRQIAPMFNINATMDNRDPTGAVANQIFEGSNRELVQAAFIGVHEDAMSAAMYAPTLAWWRLHLMGDDAAKTFFYPDKTCGLCVNPAWTRIRYKNTP